MTDFGVIGLGLIGGSIARALRADDTGVEIVGVETDLSIRATAEKSGAVSRAVGSVTDAALEKCSTIFVCTPVGAIRSVFEAVAVSAPAATITDVAGVKGVVQQWAAELVPGRFVGGHPMAGGARGGFEQARADLFTDAAVAVCPAAAADDDATDAIVDLWKRMGARPIIVSAHEHDRIVAQTSHLPYLAAVAQMQLLEKSPEAAKLVGKGFFDATRHAEFAPEVMAEIVCFNPAVAAQVRRLAEALTKLAEVAAKPRALRDIATRLRKLRSGLG